MVLSLQHSCSLRTQAILAGISAAKTISKQGLHKRLGGNAAAFLQRCLSAAIASRVSLGAAMLPACFGRILVQDSTCLSLPPLLAGIFPGPANQSGKKQACLRIQCIYDLLSEGFLAFSLSPFTRNDQAAACDLLPLLKPSDMVLRDLGYFTIDSLKAIAATGAFFLTRLRYAVTLFSPASAEVINLAKMLQAHTKLDTVVLLGLREKFPVRLLAFPLPEPIANDRRRKARAMAKRDKRLNPSKDYLFLLGWKIFLTNAPEDMLLFDVAAKLYRLRWRIEILFKAWKSHLGLRNACKLGSRQVEVLVYGLLLFAVLMHNNIPLAFITNKARDPATEHPPLSLLRVSQFFGNWLLPFWLATSPPKDLLQQILAQLNTPCRYDRRHRKNYTNLRSDFLS